MKGIRAVVLGALLCIAADGVASDHPNLDAGAIRDQQRELRTAAETGKGVFKDLPDARKREMFDRQDRVLALVRDRSRTTELTERQQIELFNNLEAIQAIIDSNEDERMICRRERATGTNRPQTICKTVAQRRAERESVERDTGRRTLECSEATMGPGGCQR
ncbi:hypothetical protein [Luteimonas terrae]|uniref:Uncharacterized protein n=1 Tax=Luteimonas terrae TaxID=1530191 RepID=A0A4R5U5M7_9GAMM|nr:hypothetical protein [Luteimonas terrae]TDK29214.1 hypothetical protein E2F49_14845 [Luteimonas terrae]